MRQATTNRRRSLTDLDEIRVLAMMGVPLTHAEIAVLEGISRSMVHKIEKQAIAKLRMLMVPEAVAAAERSGK